MRSAVDERVAAILSQVDPSVLREAMEHATGGGKRVRPLLCMLSCAAAGGRALDALDAGVALELLHTSSLIHDDIMDNGDVRRGRATIHVAYDLPTALLAGDTLIALAFRTLQRIPGSNSERIRMMFSNAFVHLCEGQSYDLAFSRVEAVTSHEHRSMVEKKTARLLEAAAAIGAMLARAEEGVIGAFGEFGLSLGLAYQAQDDLLDEIGAEHVAGKSVGIDRRNGKKTFLTLVHPQADTTSAVGALVTQYTAIARSALESVPRTVERDLLLAMAENLIGREC